MNYDYFVCMIDYGHFGREAKVNPELTKRNIIDLIRSGEFNDALVFIHRVHDGVCEDLTDEFLAEAEEEKNASDM
jgi:hypothetical protein